MARQRKRGRAVDGILLLDKPEGITSNAALQRVKNLFYAAKAGHTGSLDPIATGMLPVCFGEATKFSQYLLDSDKRYIVKGKLGEKTETADREGEVIQTRDVAISEPQLAASLTSFRGTISQVPSMYSALKHKGEPLYKLARKGITVERQAREVRIHALELRSFDGTFFELDVACSKGTYIRNLVEDIGDLLECGAHVVELRRLDVGPYLAEQMITLEQLEAVAGEDKYSLDRLLLPVETSVAHWPTVELSDNAAYYLKMGQAVQVPGAPLSGWVTLKENGDQFIGLGEIDDDGRVAPRRLIRMD